MSVTATLGSPAPVGVQSRSATSRRYGQPGDEPTELLGFPGVRFASGDLGPGLAVAQGLAAASPERLVVVVIRDGECETPAPRRRFAHVRGRFQGERASNLGLTDAEA